MDKGVGVVILNKTDYFKKLDRIIQDDTRFIKLDYDVNTDNIGKCGKAPWIIKEDSVQTYCRNYIKPIVDKEKYWEIYPKGSQPGKLYGMAKNHKKDCPMRPVLSAIKTPEYHLAKWLEKQIKPFLSDNYSVSSSSAFVEEIQKIKPQPSDVIVSFDIKSLYTNVPLKEVVDDIAKTVYSDSKISNPFADSKITQNVFRNMLKVCSESIFLYNETVYKQCDGVAMGSPLAPLLANWFVCKLENKILTDPHHVAYRPTIYKRYVDDIFAVFESSEARDLFFNALNDAHHNLTFTMETTKDSLPFLDVSITIKKGKYNTQVYRKPTNTGILMSYDCVAPTKWKRSLVKCMLLRAYRVSSEADYFSSEVDKIKDSLKKNGYPDPFFEGIINNFLETHNITPGNFPGQLRTEKRKEDDPHKKVYFSIPYVGKPSITLQHRVYDELKECGLTTVAAYTTTKVGSYFNLKSRTPKLFVSNLVYKFICSRDETTTYIGETNRHLFRRIADHAGKDKKSAVFDHLLNCADCQSTRNISESFEIVQKCEAYNILSSEALWIAKLRPPLNTQCGPCKGTRVALKLYN